VITDLLLGAVYADDAVRDTEQRAVRKLLSELLEAEGVPAEVDARLRGFDHRAFDLAAAAADFAADPPINKRRLLELVAAVRDADDEIDLAEDEYLVALARALDLPESDYADLRLEYEVDELREHLGALRAAPPPVPDDA